MLEPAERPGSVAGSAQALARGEGQGPIEQSAVNLPSCFRQQGIERFGLRTARIVWARSRWFLAHPSTMSHRTGGIMR